MTKQKDAPVEPPKTASPPADAPQAACGNAAACACLYGTTGTVGTVGTIGTHGTAGSTQLAGPALPGTVGAIPACIGTVGSVGTIGSFAHPPASFPLQPFPGGQAVRVLAPVEAARLSFCGGLGSISCVATGSVACDASNSCRGCCCGCCCPKSVVVAEPPGTAVSTRLDSPPPEAFLGAPMPVAAACIAMPFCSSVPCMACR